ncbi:MAG: DUF1572 family protein [Flavobacteriaceae bacterium]|tara:strand:- start:97 stop:600 length:504 start_codon:yes stop_codon:yes gene_type:complete
MELNEEMIIEIKKNSIYRIEENLRMILICFDKITEIDLWNKPSKKGVAFGNQIIHIVGNMTQYLISALGEKKVNRERDKEFIIDKSMSKKSLKNMLSLTIKESKKTINKLSVENLLKTRKVQVYTLSGIGCLIHAVEHFSYHTGQIALLTKNITNNDLGFYNGIDLN